MRPTTQRECLIRLAAVCRGRLLLAARDRERPGSPDKFGGLLFDFFAAVAAASCGTFGSGLAAFLFVG
jgi:hypothetical protein